MTWDGRDERQQAIREELLRESAHDVQERIASALERIADVLERPRRTTEEHARIEHALKMTADWGKVKP